MFKIGTGIVNNVFRLKLKRRMPSLLEVAKSNPFNSPVAASGDGLVEFGSAEYYGKCMIGGALSCGLTHTAVVPLDLVKCRMQVDAAKYPSLGKGLKVNIQPRILCINMNLL